MLASAALLVPNYYRAFTPKWDYGIVHLWSIGVEEQFYLLWPVVPVALLKRGRDVLQRALLIPVGMALIWRTILFLLGATENYLASAFDTRFDALAIGCLLAVWSTDPNAAQAATRLARRPW